MKYNELFSSAFRALRGNLLRTLLTMLGIIIGIASVIMIVSLGQGASQAITSQVSSLGTNLIFVIPGTQQPGRVSSTNTLKYSDVQAMEVKNAIPSITEVSAQATLNAEIVANGQNKNVSVLGVSSAYANINSLEIAQGEFIAPGDENTYSRVVVLGPNVVSDLFGADADPVGQTVTI